MSFHFELEAFLRKVDSFQVISKKPPKNENVHLFCIAYNVASRNFGGKAHIWIQLTKKHIYMQKIRTTSKLSPEGPILAQFD